MPVFLPVKLFFEEDPLENSWNVTSDSIAAYLANCLKAEKLVLATDVDGVYNSDPKKSVDSKLLPQVYAQELAGRARTSVDSFCPNCF